MGGESHPQARVRLDCRHGGESHSSQTRNGARSRRRRQEAGAGGGSGIGAGGWGRRLGQGQEAGGAWAGGSHRLWLQSRQALGRETAKTGRGWTWLLGYRLVGSQLWV